MYITCPKLWFSEMEALSRTVKNGCTMTWFIEIVSHYKYFGVMFKISLKWNSSRDTLATQGNKSLFNLYKLNTMCGGMPPETLFKLFDNIVAPVLCYGAEVWGYEKPERIERIHTTFGKRVLGVSFCASNVAVLGDCGRYPLFISYFTKCIKCWLKLLNIDNNRITKKCYLLSKKNRCKMAARHGVHYYVDMVLILFGKIKGSGIPASSCLNSFSELA